MLKKSFCPSHNSGGFLLTLHMKYLLLLLLFSCKSYSVHEQNLIDQQKTMLRHDEQSRKKQQKIRDSRKKTLFRTNLNKKSKRYIS